MTTRAHQEQVWETNLRIKIKNLLKRGFIKFDEILPQCDGAQPKDAFRIFNELKDTNFGTSTNSLDYKSKFFFKLPAANPKFFQWWYLSVR